MNGVDDPVAARGAVDLGVPRRVVVRAAGVGRLVDAEDHPMRPRREIGFERIEIPDRSRRLLARPQPQMAGQPGRTRRRLRAHVALGRHVHLGGLVHHRHRLVVLSAGGGEGGKSRERNQQERGAHDSLPLCFTAYAPIGAALKTPAGSRT